MAGSTFYNGAYIRVNEVRRLNDVFASLAEEKAIQYSEQLGTIWHTDSDLSDPNGQITGTENDMFLGNDGSIWSWISGTTWTDTGINIKGSSAWNDIAGKPDLVEEAPEDSTTYGRKDGEWIDIAESVNLQFRQGTDLERQQITPLSGEPIYTTDTKKLYIGDGNTVGGNLLRGSSSLDFTLIINSDNTVSGYVLTSIANSQFSSNTGIGLRIGNSVTSIGDLAFNNCSGFTGTLTIPSSVTTISSGAFSYCSGFTGTLTIPDSVTTIGSYAFYYCSGFTGPLTIPSSVTSIGNSAFNNCSGFTGTLTIPSSVISIGNSAFQNCTGFTALTIPSSVTTIDGNVFYGCTGFTGTLTIPDSVTTISSNAFGGCTGFTGTLNIPSSVTSIGSLAFYGCTGFTGTLTIPSSVTSIGGSAFQNCTGFTGTLTIPSSVTTISSNAFRSCSGFTSVDCRTTKTVINQTNVFLDCTSLTTIHALASDVTWTAGADTIGGKAVTVIKDL